MHSTRKYATAYIALGSNLGDRAAHLREATRELARVGRVRGISSLYATEPVGPVRQGDFLNAVVQMETRLLPEDLLAELLEIERRHGRDRNASPPKGPRTLDLDLLAWEDAVMETPTLTLPHPALAERRFVLVPLVELAPEWRHPVSGKTARQLLAELENTPDGAAARVRKTSPPGGREEG